MAMEAGTRKDLPNGEKTQHLQLHLTTVGTRLFMVPVWRLHYRAVACAVRRTRHGPMRLSIRNASVQSCD
jgi:hypothetical protein